jgi:dipeptidyl aminopeptidase/acylaminoacyl peptidase
LEAKDKDGKPQLRHGINLWTFEDPSRPRPQPLIGSMGFGLLPKHIAWSPDGARIAFEAWHLKSEGERVLLGIAVINVTGQPAGVPPEMAAQFPCMIPVTAEGRPQNPRWSPDGSRLLYELARPDGGSDLCIVNTDGTNPINLTKGQGDNIQPAWSPATPK